MGGLAQRTLGTTVIHRLHILFKDDREPRRFLSGIPPHARLSDGRGEVGQDPGRTAIQFLGVLHLDQAQDDLALVGR